MALLTRVLLLVLAVLPAAAGELIVPGKKTAAPLQPLILAPGLQASIPAVCPLIVPGKADAPVLPQLQAASQDLGKAPDATLNAIYEGPKIDGLAYSPEPFLTAGDLQVREAHLARSVSQVKTDIVAVLPRLQASVARDQWNGPKTSLHTACCGDAAPKLAALLREKGHQAHLIEAEFHYYVVVSAGKARIYIDPTVRQFFGGAAAPDGVPLVFVGTMGDLNTLFLKHARSKTTKYDPSRIYLSEAVYADSKMRLPAPAPSN